VLCCVVLCCVVLCCVVVLFLHHLHTTQHNNTTSPHMSLHAMQQGHKASGVVRVLYRELLRKARTFDRIPVLRYLVFRERATLSKQQRSDLGEVYQSACFSVLHGPKALYYSPIAACHSFTDVTRAVFRHADTLCQQQQQQQQPQQQASTCSTATTSTATGNSGASHSHQPHARGNTLRLWTSPISPSSREQLSCMSFEQFAPLSYDFDRWIDTGLYFMRAFDKYLAVAHGHSFIDDAGTLLDPSMHGTLWIPMLMVLVVLQASPSSRHHRVRCPMQEHFHCTRCVCWSLVQCVL
jgi:hypothetical protein